MFIALSSGGSQVHILQNYYGFYSSKYSSKRENTLFMKSVYNNDLWILYRIEEMDRVILNNDELSM